MLLLSDSCVLLISDCCANRLHSTTTLLQNFVALCSIHHNTYISISIIVKLQHNKHNTTTNNQVHSNLLPCAHEMPGFHSILPAATLAPAPRKHALAKPSNQTSSDFQHSPYLSLVGHFRFQLLNLSDRRFGLGLGLTLNHRRCACGTRHHDCR